MAPSSSVESFVRESNRIEGILRPPHFDELRAHREFLALERVAIGDLERFVAAVRGGPLRREAGMNVVVGGYVPPPGGPSIERALDRLLDEVVGGVTMSPWEAHVAYEALHPFMDGNGRSGRVLWAWQQLRRERRDPFALAFLHRFYYDTLDERGDIDDLLYPDGG